MANFIRESKVPSIFQLILVSIFFAVTLEILSSKNKHGKSVPCPKINDFEKDKYRRQILDTTNSRHDKL